MVFVGIDLHRRSVVVAVEDANGPVGKPRRFDCADTNQIAIFFQTLTPFRAVIEASSSYRWLFEMLAPMGEVILAHPRRLRAITSGRAKTDRLDAAMLARLLRADLVPRAYVPPRPYYELRELARACGRISQQATHAKNEIHALLSRSNLHSPYVNVFCKRGRRWIATLDLGLAGNTIRDELLQRLDHYDEQRQVLDGKLRLIGECFPEQQALKCLYGIGTFTALMIIGELGEPGRFRDARTVGAYAGLTPRVSQSGESCYHGHITRQGSPWLRWCLVQAAMHFVRRDPQVRNFYQRVRKRSSAHVARVAAARKLATICWVRLRDWRGEMAPA